MSIPIFQFIEFLFLGKEDNEMCHAKFYPIEDFLFCPSWLVLRVHKKTNSVFFPPQVTNPNFESKSKCGLSN